MPPPPNPIFMRKVGQVPPKLALGHLCSYLYLPKFVFWMLFLGLVNCNTPTAFIRINTIQNDYYSETLICFSWFSNVFTSHHMTKQTKWPVHPAKTQISLGIRHLIRVFAIQATKWVHSEDSDQSGCMPRLIWVFVRHTSFCWFCHAAALISWCSPIMMTYNYFNMAQQLFQRNKVHSY